MKQFSVLYSMSLFIASLNSGSNGNCYYVGNDRHAVLVDAGISCRETELRMANLQLHMKKVKAVFISHEHVDHISGIRVLSKKYNLPVYITEATLNNTGIRLPKNLVYSFKPDEPVTIGELSVTPFVKEHDAKDPFSFVIEGDGVKVGVITDIGIACKRVIHYFKQCHACFLESNYDEQMLENGSYPPRLKKRIRGGKGHLSNTQALNLFIKHRPEFMSHLLLSHLSKNNNHPDIVQELFTKHAGKTNIIVASRYNESAVYTIQSAKKELTGKKIVPFLKENMQMSLFELASW